MDSSSDVEVVSINGENEEGNERSPPETDTDEEVAVEIFSQDVQEEEEEEGAVYEIGQHHQQNRVQSERGAEYDADMDADVEIFSQGPPEGEDAIKGEARQLRQQLQHGTAAVLGKVVHQNHDEGGGGTDFSYYDADAASDVEVLSPEGKGEDSTVGQTRKQHQQQQQQRRQGGHSAGYCLKMDQQVETPDQGRWGASANKPKEARKQPQQQQPRHNKKESAFPRPHRYSTVDGVIDVTMAEPVFGFQEEYAELLEGVEGGDFPFEAVAELLLRQPEHWWCRYPEAMTEMLLSWEAGLEGAGSSSSTKNWRGFEDNGSAIGCHITGVSLVSETSSAQLCVCRRCLRAYHAGKERVRLRLLLDDVDERSAAVEAFMTVVLAQDSRRLQRSFRSVESAAKSMVDSIASVQSRTRTETNGLRASVKMLPGGQPAATAPPSFKLGAEATHAFWEVMSYSQLLEDRGIESAFLEALEQVTSSGAKGFSGQGWERHWPGVLALLVHKNSTARGWAQSMARSAGGIGAKEYRDVLSPVIEQWVPALEQGLYSFESAATSAGQEGNERLHWSGLHVTLKLLEPSTAPLLAAGFPTLVDLVLQKFDDGPGKGAVSLYLQVCGCFLELLRLLGFRIWVYSSLNSLEALQAVKRQVLGEAGFAPGGGAGSCRSNEAIHKKALEILQLLVSSAVEAKSSRNLFGDGRSGSRGDEWRCGAGYEAQVGGHTSERGVTRDFDNSTCSFRLADAVLEFLSEEIWSLSLATGGHRPESDQGSNRRRWVVIAQAILSVLEVCYGQPMMAGFRDKEAADSDVQHAADNDSQRPPGPEKWPWNSCGNVDSAEADEYETATPCAGIRFGASPARQQEQRALWPLSWPVRSLPRWGPRLAGIAGERGRSDVKGAIGGSAGVVVDRAAEVVQLVLRAHVRLAWREALCALRHATAGSKSLPHIEAEGEALPACQPLLERICLELPLLDIPTRVHAAVFEVHGWLALLPSGKSALRAAEAAGGPRASALLAKLHSGLMSQFLKIFVPYVQGLTEAVKKQPSVSPAFRPEVAPSIFQAFLVPIPTARVALRDLILCSISAEGHISRSSGALKRGDIRQLLDRAPLDFARKCLLAVPQALGAMAAAGPHLSLKSWGPLFEAIGVLGRRILSVRPSSSASPDGNTTHAHRLEKPRVRRREYGAGNECWRDGGVGDNEEAESWSALGAIWEFVFLQVIPEALPAVREEHVTRLEDAILPLFESLESLWQFLTGAVPRKECADIADALYRSRSLWLTPLLAWVSESWLPPRAREAAGRFILCSLLPFLDLQGAPFSSVKGPHGPVASGKDTGSGSSKEEQGSFKSPNQKVVRLMGNKLVVADVQEEDCNWKGAGKSLSEEGGESKLLRKLQLEAISATANITSFSSTQMELIAPTNQFVRTALPTPTGSPPPEELSSIRSGGLVPWEKRLAQIESAEIAVGRGNVLSLGNPPPRTAKHTSPSDVKRWVPSDKDNYGNQSAAVGCSRNDTRTARPSQKPAHGVPSPRDTRVKVPGVSVQPTSWLSSALAASPTATATATEITSDFERDFTTINAPPRAGDDTSDRRLASAQQALKNIHEARSADRRVVDPELVSDTPAISAGMGFGSAPRATAESGTTNDANAGEKRYVPAADAAAVRAARARALSVEQPASAAAVAVSFRQPLSVVEKWREMQRKQAVVEPVTASVENASQQKDSRRGAKTPLLAASRHSVNTSSQASADFVTKASFAAAAQATARRNKDSSAMPLPGLAATAVAATVNHSSLVKASAAELHRLVLSSWSVSELLSASSDPDCRENLSQSTRSKRGGENGAEVAKSENVIAIMGENDLEDGEILANNIDPGGAERVSRIHSSGRGRSAEGHHGHGRERSVVGKTRLSKRLWLSKVPTRFQSVEQYYDIFRGLLLEEIFSTLVSALGGSSGGSSNGGFDTKNRGGKSGGPPAVATLRVTSFMESGEGGFSHVNMASDDWGNGNGGQDWRSGRARGAMTPASQGFFQDDVLLLSLVNAGEEAPSTVNAFGGASCLGIFEKEPRGAAQGAAGPPGRNRSSLRAKIFLQSSDNQERDRSIRNGCVPKKSSAAPPPSNHQGASGPGATLLGAFRQPGTLVRVSRLESLSTSTREFVALEAVAGVALLQYLLQATSNPRLKAVPTMPRTPANPNPRPTFGPPYSIDEDSFVDACKRLSSIEESLGSDHRVGFAGGKSDDSLADSALTELMVRSLACLASFRVTPELLTTRGKGTAKRLKILSKSKAWGPQVSNSAACLLRAWRGAVNLNNTSKTPISGPDEQRAQKGKGKAEKPDMVFEGKNDGEVASAQGVDGMKSKVSSHGDKYGSTPGRSSPSPNDQPSPPPIPSLVPYPLWERLCREFNPSQLKAVWAAAASAREIQQERQRDYQVAQTALGGAAKSDAKITGGAVNSTADKCMFSAGIEGGSRVGGCFREGAEGGVVLLQGPPGTGKTRTVLGVVSAILACQKDRTAGRISEEVGAKSAAFSIGGRGMGMTLAVGAKQKRSGVAGRWTAAKTHQRILVCAPSNGAVDELTQRLALEGGGVWDHRGKAVAPRVVRVGRPSEGAADRVMAVSLDFMVEERVNLHPKNTEAREADAKIKKAYERIGEIEQAAKNGADSGLGGVGKIGSLENRRHQASNEIRRLRREILVAKQRRRDSLRGLEAERGKLRYSLLNNAQVVCATLSGCGSRHLVEAVSSSGKGFDTVVVDEACQATEPSTLIPLSLGCKRLILVGDPRQLPATVISQQAARLKLEISLFERLEQAGHPVHMLTVQYRMHPEIRAFPSARFYDGRLTDAPSVGEVAGELKRCSRPPLSSPPLQQSPAKPLPPPFSFGPCFPPLLLADVSSGRECRVRNSYENAVEAACIAALLARLVTLGLQYGRGIGRGSDGVSSRGGRCGSGGGDGDGVVRVGVITPYRGQVRRIQQELGQRRRLKGGVEDGGVDVEISTVDGFQGREVDIALFSCVRAPSVVGNGRLHGRGIGFLADCRRMNVAITRARRSLVVLGNVDRLSSDDTWRALVDHAAAQGRLVPETNSGRRGNARSSSGDKIGEALCTRLEAIALTARDTNPPGDDCETLAARDRPGHDKTGASGGAGHLRSSHILQDINALSDEGIVGPAPSPLKVPDSNANRMDSAGRHRNEQAVRCHAVRKGDEPRNRSREGDSTGQERHTVPRKKRPCPMDARGANQSDLVPRDPMPIEGKLPQAERRMKPKKSDLAPTARAEHPAARAVKTSWAKGESTREEHPSSISEATRPKKRVRVASLSEVSDDGKETANLPRKRPGAGSKCQPFVESGGSSFLGNLMGSLRANASNIDSGKEYDFRQGLQGGKDDEVKRAAVVPRLGGARITELGRAREPIQSPPAIFSSRRPRGHPLRQSSDSSSPDYATMTGGEEPRRRIGIGSSGSGGCPRTAGNTVKAKASKAPGVGKTDNNGRRCDTGGGNHGGSGSAVHPGTTRRSVSQKGLNAPVEKRTDHQGRQDSTDGGRPPNSSGKMTAERRFASKGRAEPFPSSLAGFREPDSTSGRRGASRSKGDIIKTSNNASSSSSYASRDRLQSMKSNASGQLTPVTRRNAETARLSTAAIVGDRARPRDGASASSGSSPRRATKQKKTRLQDSQRLGAGGRGRSNRKEGARAAGSGGSVSGLGVFDILDGMKKTFK